MAAFRSTRLELKAELYDRLGLTNSYNHANRTARVMIDPGRSCTKLCPRPDVDLRYAPTFAHEAMID